MTPLLSSRIAEVFCQSSWLPDTLQKGHHPQCCPVGSCTWNKRWARSRVSCGCVGRIGRLRGSWEGIVGIDGWPETSAWSPSVLGTVSSPIARPEHGAGEKWEVRGETGPNVEILVTLSPATDMCFWWGWGFILNLWGRVKWRLTRGKIVW